MVAQNASKFGGLKKYGINPLVYGQNASYMQSRADFDKQSDFVYTTVTDNIRQNLLKLNPDRKTLEPIVL